MGNKELVPSGLMYMADNITSKHNILGAPRGVGAKWAKSLNLARDTETVFFAGCGYQYTSELESLMSLLRKMDKSAIGAELPARLAGFQKKLGIDAAGMVRRVLARGADAGDQPLRDAVKVLNGLGIRFGYLGEEEPCCGGILHYIGLEKEFAENARRVHESLESLGVKQIITIVPSCTYTLKSLIPNYADGYSPQVRHFSEIVAEKIPSLKLRFPREVRVTYHDPCQLARFLGLTEEPRRILRAIALVETEWTKEEWATCCGGGGGFEAVFPEMSHILAVNRAKELLETGAEIIITHCPGCIMQLKSGLKELKRGDVEVFDLAQIVAEAMGVQ
jgi:Fe-S oxidoreductase